MSNQTMFSVRRANNHINRLIHTKSQRAILHTMININQRSQIAILLMSKNTKLK